MSLPEINKYAGSYRKALEEYPEDRRLNTSIAMCYLRLKLYDKANAAFDKAIEDNFEDADTFFYATIGLLKGQKAFVAKRADIDKMVEYLNAAIMIDSKPVFRYLMAYIKQDYFDRKYLNITPNWKVELTQAVEEGLTLQDTEEMFALLGITQPDEFS
jgi:tetratricopeptide (TPR) repeat protein